MRNPLIHRLIFLPFRPPFSLLCCKLYQNSLTLLRTLPGYVFRFRQTCRGPGWESPAPLLGHRLRRLAIARGYPCADRSSRSGNKVLASATFTTARAPSLRNFCPVADVLCPSVPNKDQTDFRRRPAGHKPVRRKSIAPISPFGALQKDGRLPSHARESYRDHIRTPSRFDAESA